MSSNNTQYPEQVHQPQERQSPKTSAQTPTPAFQQPYNQDVKKTKVWIVLLIVWLASWPLSFTIALTARMFSVEGMFTNILVILLSTYGVVGWIPVLVVYLIKKK